MILIRHFAYKSALVVLLVFWLVVTTTSGYLQNSSLATRIKFYEFYASLKVIKL